MNERKLTPKEIDNLFEFCEIHNVHYYDVQIELVDHFASSIEKLWESNAELPFEEALYMVGEQFNIEAGFNVAKGSLLPPISGKSFQGESAFEVIIEAKENEIRRKYERLQGKYIKEFFRLPKIILTLAVTLLIFFIFKLIANDFMVIVIIHEIFFVSLIAYWIVYYPRKCKLEITHGKSFLLYKYFKTTRRTILSLALTFQVMILNTFNISTLIKFDSPIFLNFIIHFIAAFLITISFVIIVAIGIYTPRRVKEDFLSEYPQFVKS